MVDRKAFHSASESEGQLSSWVGMKGQPSSVLCACYLELVPFCRSKMPSQDFLMTECFTACTNYLSLRTYFQQWHRGHRVEISSTGKEGNRVADLGMESCGEKYTGKSDVRKPRRDTLGELEVLAKQINKRKTKCQWVEECWINCMFVQYYIPFERVNRIQNNNWKSGYAKLESH